MQADLWKKAWPHEFRTASGSPACANRRSSRSIRRSMKETKDVNQAKETIEALQQQLEDLEAQFKSETDSMAATLDPQTETFDTITVRPAKTNITVRLMALA
jgi:hypothetical protein